MYLLSVSMYYLCADVVRMHAKTCHQTWRGSQLLKAAAAADNLSPGGMGACPCLVYLMMGVPHDGELAP